MYRNYTCGELRIEHVGKVVTLAGWVQRTRKMGGITFVDLRDRYGITQLVADSASNEAVSNAVAALGREYVIQITGRVAERQSKNSKIATGDIRFCLTTSLCSILQSSLLSQLRMLAMEVKIFARNTAIWI